MVLNPFYRYRSSMDASHNQTTSFGLPSQTSMAGFIANIVEVGGLRRRSSSSSRCSVSDDLKRPSLLRNQATVEPCVATTLKKGVGRSLSSAGRTRTATDILSRVVVVSSQHPSFVSPVGSPSSCGPQSPASEVHSPNSLGQSRSHTIMNDGSISISDAYFSFPRFSSWDGEEEYDCEPQKAEI